MKGLTKNERKFIEEFADFLIESGLKIREALKKKEYDFILLRVINIKQQSEIVDSLVYEKRRQ
jgi:hypothetical protein